MKEVVQIFLSIFVVISVHGGISYLPHKILLADWLGLNPIQTSERSAIECATGCNKLFKLDKSCNAIIFDESNNICSKAAYVLGPPDGENTGLRVAWASSVHGDHYTWFAIDRNLGVVAYFIVIQMKISHG